MAGQPIKYDASDPVTFLHPPKVAGCSIEQALRHPGNHYTAQELLDCWGPAVFFNRFIVTAIREPRDRALSWYFFAKYNAQYGDTPDDFKEWVLGGMPIGKGDIALYSRVLFQEKYIEINGDNAHLKFIIRFESLEEDFHRLIAEL